MILVRILVVQVLRLVQPQRQDIGTRENEGTVRDSEGVGQHMSIPLKLYMKSVFRYVYIDRAQP